MELTGNKIFLLILYWADVTMYVIYVQCAGTTISIHLLIYKIFTEQLLSYRYTECDEGSDFLI